MSWKQTHIGEDSTIGPYQFLEQIGAGGMADIYLGIKKSLTNIRTFYAIKVVKPSYAQNEHFASMFMDEARVMASIHHPNLVNLHDMLAYEGQYLIVMEFLKGLDGRGLIRGAEKNRTTIPMDIAVNVVRQACSGLHHAHQAKSIEGDPLNLVHRDISPHNIFVTFDGHVKVLDFGIAKSNIQHETTKSGLLKGKIPYLSPEQCSSDLKVDHRTDVFSLGVVLYEFLTAKRPFEGRNDVHIIQSILYSDPVSPASYNPRIPAELSSIVLRALSNKAADRFQDCEAFQAALDRVARKNGWTLSEREVAKYISKAHSELKDNLESHLVELLETADDMADSHMVVSFDETDERLIDLGPDCTCISRKHGPYTGYTFSGQIRESFEFDGITDPQGNLVVLDLAGISRVTSFGIRQWLALLPRLRRDGQVIVLNRVSVAMTNQLVIIPAMTNHVNVMSLMAPFRCTSCGHTFDSVLRAGLDIPMIIECVRCGSMNAQFDEDDIYLTPLRNGTPPDGPLQLFLREVESEGEVTTTTAVEKQITADRTEINLQGDIPKSTRWDRILAGVEGELRVTFAPGAKIAKDTWEKFEASLQAVKGDVDLAILGFPARDLDELRLLHAAVPHIKSAILQSPCAKCQHVAYHEWTFRVTGANATCRRCGESLTVELEPPKMANTVIEAPQTPSAGVSSSQGAIIPTSTSHNPNGSSKATVVFSVIVVVLIIAIFAVIFI